VDKNTFIWRDLPLDAFNDGEQFLMLIPKSHRLSGKRGRTDGLASLSDGSSRTRFPFGPQYLMKDRCEADQHALRDIAVVAFAASMTRHLCSRETYHPFQRVNILRATPGECSVCPSPKTCSREPNMARQEHVGFSSHVAGAYDFQTEMARRQGTPCRSEWMYVSWVHPSC